MSDCVVFGEHGLGSEGQLVREQALLALTVRRKFTRVSILDRRLRALKSTSEGSKSASDAGSGSSGSAAVSIMFAGFDALRSKAENEKKKRKSLSKSGS